jgi:predicted nucleic acid-binding protein
MKYLIDTDIASYYLRGKHNLVEAFEKKGPSSVRLSIVTVAQMEVLAHKNPYSKVNLSNIWSLAQVVGILGVDRQTWRIFSVTKAETEKAGMPKGDLDILQASIAKQHGLIVVSHNTEHYKGIVACEDWTKT